VIYGGGITTAAQAARAGAIADTVVVGNLVYQDPLRLRGTVQALKAV
jgi:putative glycerol-1-phosphate prenyltransferase